MNQDSTLSNPESVENSERKAGSSAPFCSAFDGVMRDPIDRTAAMMFSKGVAPPDVKITCDHWETCPPMKARALVKYQMTDEDLTGRRQGRFVVMGMARDRKARWVVRCDCGCFEIRTAKALRNPNNADDKCVKCRKLDQAKRHHEFVTTGRNRDDLKQNDLRQPPLPADDSTNTKDAAR